MRMTPLKCPIGSLTRCSFQKNRRPNFWSVHHRVRRVKRRPPAVCYSTEMGSDFFFVRSARAAHYNGDRRRRDGARQAARAVQSASRATGLLRSDRPASIHSGNCQRKKKKRRRKKSVAVLLVFPLTRPDGAGPAAGACGGLQEQGGEPDGRVAAEQRGHRHVLLVAR